MHQERYAEIDFLRGIAIFVMILIHTNFYFLGTSFTAKILWEVSQFAVQAFVFCSAFIFFLRGKDTWQNGFGLYVKKRLKRLLIPYYLFLPVFMTIVFLKDNTAITPTYILQSIFVTGGIEINWLVLLFLMFIFLIPAIVFFQHKSKLLFYGYFALSLLSSIYFMFFPMPYAISYKLIMWLPWSLLFFFAIYFIRYHKAPWFYPVTLTVSGILFLLLGAIEILTNHNLSLYDNKYPPTLYFLIYGMFAITVIIRLAKSNKLPHVIQKSIHFLSIYSYSLYFIHYIILTILTGTLSKFHYTWYTFFPVVFIPTILLQLLINKITQTPK